MLYVNYTSIKDKEEERELPVSVQVPRRGLVRIPGEGDHLQAGRGFSLPPDCAGTTISDFQPLELWENAFLLFKPNNNNNYV